MKKEPTGRVPGQAGKAGPGTAKRGSLTEVAVERIRAIIKDNHLVEGDLLPSEANLAEQIGVSRRVVREALRVLVPLGLVTVLPGKGTIIGGSENRLDYFTAVITSAFELGEHEIEDLIELRMLIERFCAPRVVQNATEEDLGELERLVGAIGRVGNTVEKSGRGRH